MASATLAPGFRFHPTDVELIMYYLKRKVTGREIPAEAKRAITELNICHYSPWELPGKSSLKSKDLVWYFYSPRERKYGSGCRTKRATDTGYWKATGKDRFVKYDGRTVGVIRTLVFYEGRPPGGRRTDWVIHEYRLEDKHLADAGIVQDTYVLCKVFEKPGSGPKNGSQYGVFMEEDWEEQEACLKPDLSGVSPAIPAHTDWQSCPVMTSPWEELDRSSDFSVVNPAPTFAQHGLSLAELHTNEMLPLSGVSPAIPAHTDCQSCPVMTSPWEELDRTADFSVVKLAPTFAEHGLLLAELHTNEVLPDNGSQYGVFREEDWEEQQACLKPDLSGVSPAIPAHTDWSDCQSCPVMTSPWEELVRSSDFSVVNPAPTFAEHGLSLAELHTNEMLPLSGVSPAIPAHTDCQSCLVMTSPWEELDRTADFSVDKLAPTFGEHGLSLAELHTNEVLPDNGFSDELGDLEEQDPMNNHNVFPDIPFNDMDNNYVELDDLMNPLYEFVKDLYP